jgi:hypothetical protein
MEEYPKILLEGNLDILKRSMNLYTTTGVGLETVYHSLLNILDVLARETTPDQNRDPKLYKCNIAIDKCAFLLAKNLRL